MLRRELIEEGDLVWIAQAGDSGPRQGLIVRKTEEECIGVFPAESTDTNAVSLRTMNAETVYGEFRKIDDTVEMRNTPKAAWPAKRSAWLIDDDDDFPLDMWKNMIPEEDAASAEQSRGNANRASDAAAIARAVELSVGAIIAPLLTRIEAIEKANKKPSPAPADTDAL